MSSCPSCGTVAGIDPTLADGAFAGAPKLSLVAPPVEGRSDAPPPPVSAGPRVQGRRPALPEELTRAWDISATPRTKPVVVRRRRRIAAGVLAALVLAGGGVAIGTVLTRPQPPAATPARAYAAPGAPFRVAFPAPTLESHATMHLVGIPYTSTAYTAVDGAQVFSASVYPFPLGKPKMTATQFLRTFTAGVASAKRLSVPGSTATTFRGLPALATLFVAPGRTLYTKVLAVLDGHVAYVLMVSGDSPAPAGYARFVNSFSLLGS